MKRLLIAAAFGMLSISACAKAPASADEAKAPQAAAAEAPETTKPAAGSPEERAVAAIAALNPEVKVDYVGKAPLPGFREAVVGGQVIYISDDGNYLLFTGAGGALLDTRTRKNLSEATLGGMRNKLLKTIPASERIVFAPPNPKHTVTVFTDVECGYCRKMHEEIKQYNAEGIAVEYLAFPRMGIGSEGYNDMVSVWCSPDRKSALTRAKSTGEVENHNCRNTVAEQYKVGQSVGLTGTPMIIARDGSQLGGYLPAKELRAALDKLDASDG